MWVPKPTSPFESDVSKETKLVAKKSGETWKVRGDAIAIIIYLKCAKKKCFCNSLEPQFCLGRVPKHYAEHSRNWSKKKKQNRWRSGFQRKITSQIMAQKITQELCLWHQEWNREKESQQIPVTKWICQAGAKKEHRNGESHAWQHDRPCNVCIGIIKIPSLNLQQPFCKLSNLNSHTSLWSVTWRIGAVVKANRKLTGRAFQPAAYVPPGVRDKQCQKNEGGSKHF
jgi:hypothetical protein